MVTISNKEAALLGLISEKPKHAYEVESDIKFRDMRYWTEISMSSIYKLLNKLEERGLLASELKLSEKNINQKVYSLTENGREEFRERLKQVISKWEPTIYPIDIGLSNMFLLEKDEALESLGKYSESLDKMIKCYQDLEDFLIGDGCDLSNVQLATRRVYMLKGEKKWIEDFMRRYEDE